VFLIVGLQGSGKTTSTGKLARWLSKNGHRPQMVSVDVYRPAAREQLKVIARDSQQTVYEGTPRRRLPRIGAWSPPRSAQPAAMWCWWIPPAACISTKT
jgi:signal recognition particle GTPase